MATNDVDSIIALAGPALDVIYPVVIVLIALTLLGGWVKSNRVVAITVYVVLGLSLLTTCATLFDITALKAILAYLPFNEMGLGWCLPAILVFLTATLLTKSND